MTRWVQQLGMVKKGTSSGVSQKHVHMDCSFSSPELLEIPSDAQRPAPAPQLAAQKP